MHVLRPSPVCAQRRLASNDRNCSTARSAFESGTRVQLRASTGTHKAPAMTDNTSASTSSAPFAGAPLASQHNSSGSSGRVFGRGSSTLTEHRPVPSHHAGSSSGLTSALIALASNKTLEELNAPMGAVQRVAYQGVPGAYSEVAASKACPDLDPLPCEQFEVAFQALTQWMVDRSVLPIENSLGGSIHAVYDLLLRYRLHIVGETSLVIKHCLVALPGTRKEDITRVMSHPQALAQCDNYLRAMGVIKEAVDDTAGAAQMVARQRLQGVGAISSRRAAQLYGLDIVEESVQDIKDNITRFIVLSRDPLVTSDNDMRTYKTSIVFSLPKGPGQLFRSLSVFALRDIDMTKIESRPLRSSPMLTLKPEELASIDGAAGSVNLDGTPTPQNRFNYLFYIDFVGSLADLKVQNALRHLQETAPFMRVLGSYPMQMDVGAMVSDEHNFPARNGSAPALN